MANTDYNLYKPVPLSHTIHQIMKNLYLVISFITVFYAVSFAQNCEDNEVAITVQVISDDYGNETAWTVADIQTNNIYFSIDLNTYGNNQTNIHEFCIPEDACVIFTITDSYGDGICCGYGQGSYEVSLGGDIIVSGGNFDDEESIVFNCAPGTVCSEAIPADEGSYTTENANYWYVFTPAESGMYGISTCNINDCDTRIWIYDNCLGNPGDSSTGTIHYNDDNPECDEAAQLQIPMGPPNTYYIRIGDTNNDCESVGSINWELSFITSVIEGCTDPQADNYDPLANEDDNSCIYIPPNSILLDSTILTEREVAIGLQVPWEILWGSDDHIWATERRGRVLRIDPENGNTTTILNIENLVTNEDESGLLGMVLHPDFDSTPKVYLAYNYTQNFFTKERLVSYDWDGMTLSNETILLDEIEGGSIHNGSRLLITPDQKILMTTGDAGNSSSSQSMSSLSGKLLRINIDGSIPDDNPNANSYIYTLGHRNAQGLAYGPNGQLYSSEHGAQASDELNMIESNRNYGWPQVQGACNTGSEINFCDAFNVREPLIEWSPCIAVSGIDYYDHEAIPEWRGSMLMAILVGANSNPNRLAVLEFNEDGTDIVNEERYFGDYGRLRDVCINPHNGAIFMATNGPDYPGSGPNRIIEYRNLAYQVTSTTSPSTTTQFVKVFPNPVGTRMQLTVQFSDNFIGSTFELIAFTGQIVDVQKITSTMMNISTKNLSAGNYYIKAANDEGTITRKVIVQ